MIRGFPESKSSVKNVEFKMADPIWRPAERETILFLFLPNSEIIDEVVRIYLHIVFVFIFLLVAFISYMLCFFISF